MANSKEMQGGVLSGKSASGMSSSGGCEGAGGRSKELLARVSGEQGGELYGIKKLAMHAGSSVPKIKPFMAQIGMIDANSLPTQGAINAGFAALRQSNEKNVERWGCEPYYPVWTAAALAVITEKVSLDDSLAAKSTAIGGRDGAIALLEHALDSVLLATGQCSRACEKESGIDSLEDFFWDWMYPEVEDDGELVEPVVLETLRVEDVFGNQTGKSASRQVVLFGACHCPQGKHRNLWNMEGRFLGHGLEYEGNRDRVLRELAAHRRFMLRSEPLATDVAGKNMVAEALADLKRIETWAKRYAWDRICFVEYAEGKPNKRKPAKRKSE